MWRFWKGLPWNWPSSTSSRRENKQPFQALCLCSLCWPWATGFSQIADSLTKTQLKAYNAKFDEEARGFFREEDYNWLNSKQQEKLDGEDAERCMNLMDGFYKHLHGKFKKWTGNDNTIKTLFWSDPDLHYLPEVEQIVKDFCNEMLEVEPIRDCNINIRGWQ